MTQTYENRLIRVLDYIHENPAADLSLDALSDVAAMSRFHWHRVFRAMTGETCAQAVRRLRLHRAAVWLLESDDDFDQITRRCGYDNARSFAQVFTRSYGMTPLDFRNRGELRAQIRRSQTGELPMHEVTIQTLPTQRLACLPHKGSYQEIGATFEKLNAILGARNLWPQVQGMAGVYYDDPSSVETDELRSHAGVIVDESFETDESMDIVVLAAGPHAVLRFKGPYAELPRAYDDFYGRWLPQSGHIPSDAAPFEVYLNSPSDVAPEELLTDICVPLVSNES